MSCSGPGPICMPVCIYLQNVCVYVMFCELEHVDEVRLHKQKFCHMFCTDDNVPHERSDELYVH